MSLNFFDKDKRNKAQWHFPKENENNTRGYDLSDEDIHNDVLGSYTGTPYDGVRPIQDADDL